MPAASTGIAKQQNKQPFRGPAMVWQGACAPGVGLGGVDEHSDGGDREVWRTTGRVGWVFVFLHEARLFGRPQGRAAEVAWWRRRKAKRLHKAIACSTAHGAYPQLRPLVAGSTPAGNFFIFDVCVLWPIL